MPRCYTGRMSPVAPKTSPYARKPSPFGTGGLAFLRLENGSGYLLFEDGGRIVIGSNQPARRSSPFTRKASPYARS